MKKLLKAISQITLIIITIIHLSPATYAEESIGLDNIKTAFTAGQTCISDEEKNSGKIIQIIEEPFATPVTKEDLIIKNCFRNILEYSFPNSDKTTTHGTESKLLLQCEDSIAGFADTYKAPPYNMKFTCQEIQVILSKPGTTFLYNYIGTIFTWSASIVGLISVVIIIYSGLRISASGGEPDEISQGKTRIIQSIAGLALLFLSALILNTANPNFFV